MRIWCRALLKAIVGLNFASLALAAPSDDFRRGAEAFSNEHYDQALRYFLDAEKSGMRAPTLHYNLGATYFRLGRMDEALAQFGAISDDAAWGALAHYNIGLIHDERHHRDQAIEHYRLALEHAQSVKMKALAAAKLESESAPRLSEDQKWKGLVSLAAGYDDNVLLSDNENTLFASNQHDYFSELHASAGRYIQGRLEDGWRLDLGGDYRAYSKLNDFNFGSAESGLVYSRLFDVWYLQTGGKLEAQTTGGQYFATVGTIHLQALSSLGPLVLRVYDFLSYYQSSSTYDFLGGWQNRSAVDLTRRFPSTRFRFGYELELNNREDFRLGNEFFSYSPLRHRIFADVQQRLTSVVQIDAYIEYRSSRYDEANVQQNTDGSFTIANRHDHRFAGSARLTYAVSETFHPFVNYDYSSNDSNFNQFSYANNQISLGVEKTF